MNEVQEKEIESNLKDSNKLKRRKGLNDFHKYLAANEEKFGPEDLNEIFNKFGERLISLLCDESEINRSKACKLLQYFLERKVKNKAFINFVIPSLYNRIGKVPLIEECEDNRLDFMILIDLMLDTFSSELEVYANDLCSIFVNSLMDNFPDIVAKTCDCIQNVSQCFKTKFKMFSNSLIKPLIRNISKHRFKIRIKCITTIGTIIVFGDCHDFAEVCNDLKKSMFDIPQVRLSLLSFGHLLGLQMKNRYSFWHEIIPFVLFGLRDEDLEIKEMAIKYWREIGQQYEKENEDLKESEFCNNAFELTKHSPVDYDFGIGCSSILERSFYRMLTGITSWANDWQVNVRLESIKLLTVSVVGLKGSSLQYSNKIIQILMHLAQDQDPRIVKECMVCSQCLGYFVPPDLYIPLIQPYLSEEKSSECILMVFSTLVCSTPPERIKENLSKFISILSFDNFQQLTIPNCHRDVLIVMEHVVSNSQMEEFDVDFMFTLFYIYERGKIMKMEDIIKKCFEVLSSTAKNLGFDSLDVLMSHNLGKCLEKLSETSEWEDDSDPQLLVFLFLASFTGFSRCLLELKALLDKKISSENTNPLVLYRVHEALKSILERISQEGEEALLIEFIVFLLRNYVAEWLFRYKRSVGEGVRLSTLSFMIFLLNLTKSEEKLVYEALKPCLKHVPDLIREDVRESRILTVGLIEAVATKFAEQIEDSDFLEYIQIVSDRLDDDDEGVRRATIRALRGCVETFSGFERRKDRVPVLMDSVSVFMLEEDVDIRAGVLEILKILGKHDPDHFRKLKQSSDLLQAFEDISIN